MINVDVIHCGFNACGFWRIIHPYSLFQSDKINVYIHNFSEYNIYATTADVVIIQRPMLDWTDEIQKLQAKGKKVVIELDDMFPVLENHPQYDFFGNSHYVAGLFKSLAVCDAISVSTPELKKYYQSKFPNKYIECFLNCLSIDPIITSNKLDKKYEKSFKILWAGSESHKSDLEKIKIPLTKFLIDNQDAVLFLMSYVSMNEIFTDPFIKKRIVDLDPYPLEEFFHIQAQFDVIIAPLEDNIFNQCKSEVKILEAATYTVPVIASDVAAYRRFYQNSQGEGCLLAKTDLDWINHLTTLKNNIGTRQVIGMLAYTTSTKNYDIFKENKYREKFLLNVYNTTLLSSSSSVINKLLI